MILKRTTNNNGYGCSCCSQTWSACERIEELLLPSFEEVLEEALSRDPYGNYGDTITCSYERSGKVIYGYNLDVERRSYTIRIDVGNERFTYDETGEKGMTREQMLEKIK